MTDIAPIADIRIGDRYRSHPGNLDTLAASIRARGILVPVTVGPEGQLVTGWRRIVAAQRAGLRAVPIVRVWRLDDIAAALTAEAAHDECREPMRFSDTMHLTDIMHGIEYLHRDRERRERGTAVRRARKLGQPDPVFEPRSLRQDIDRALGMGIGEYSRMHTIWRARTSDEPDTRAAALTAIERLDTGATIVHHAVEAVRATRNPRERIDPAVWAKTVRRVAAGLTGTTHVLNSLPRTPGAIPSAEAATLATDLAATITALYRTIRHLKETSK